MNEIDTLVLSGGSVNGLVMLGSLQFLYDNNYIDKVNKYVATSCGALISYLLSIGFKPTEILTTICLRQIIEKLQNIDIGSVFRGSGSISFMVIQEEIERVTIEKIGYLPTLADIKNNFDKELYMTTFNITREKTEYLSWKTYPSLPCMSAIRMTCNIPFVFDNFKYGDSFYIDGALSDNLPLDLGCSIGNNILALYISTHDIDKDDMYKNNIPELGMLEYIYKILKIPMKQLMKMKIEHTDKTKCKVYRIKPFTVSTFLLKVDPKHKLNMFVDGYHQISKMFNTD